MSSPAGFPVVVSTEEAPSGLQVRPIPRPEVYTVRVDWRADRFLNEDVAQAAGDGWKLSALDHDGYCERILRGPPVDPREIETVMRRAHEHLAHLDKTYTKKSMDVCAGVF